MATVSNDYEIVETPHNVPSSPITSPKQGDLTPTSPTMSASLNMAELSKEELLKKLEKRNEQLKEARARAKFFEDKLWHFEEKHTRQAGQLANKVEKTKTKLNEIVNKEKRVKVLTDTIRLSVQQGKIELSGR
jgi:predicted nuclease with TOPRIM domain